MYNIINPFLYRYQDKFRKMNMIPYLLSHGRHVLEIFLSTFLIICWQRASLLSEIWKYLI